MTPPIVERGVAADLRHVEVAVEGPADDLARREVLGLGACADRVLQLRVEADRYDLGRCGSEPRAAAPAALQRDESGRLFRTLYRRHVDGSVDQVTACSAADRARARRPAA